MEPPKQHRFFVMHPRLSNTSQCNKHSAPNIEYALKHANYWYLNVARSSVYEPIIAYLCVSLPGKAVDNR